jgi:hypothetical protein
MRLALRASVVSALCKSLAECVDKKGATVPAATRKGAAKTVVSKKVAVKSSAPLTKKAVAKTASTKTSRPVAEKAPRKKDERPKERS